MLKIFNAFGGFNDYPYIKGVIVSLGASAVILWFVVIVVRMSMSPEIRRVFVVLKETFNYLFVPKDRTYKYPRLMIFLHRGVWFNSILWMVVFAALVIVSGVLTSMIVSQGHSVQSILAGILAVLISCLGICLFRKQMDNCEEEIQAIKSTLK